MSNVIQFPGQTKGDLPPNQVLQAAIDEGLKTVVVIAYDKDGEEYFASSVADGGTALWLVERFKKRLLDLENHE